MTTKAFGYVAPVERSNDFGVGKWSRIATYGLKRQQQPDGSWYEVEFDDAKFAQAIPNFLKMFAARKGGMGSDCEHQTVHASANGQEAQVPALFGGIAWIKGDAIEGAEWVRDGVTPIDPVAERQRLQLEHPRTDGDPGGIWAFCSEVTEYGREVIPNYRQLSPLFNENERLEDGTEIGFAFLNVSFVNVAHQTGTNFAFSKGNLQMDGLKPEEMRAKLSKHGLGETGDQEAYSKALASYMADSDDPPAMRKAMAESCAKHTAAMAADAGSGDDDDDEEKKKKDKEKEDGAMSKVVDDLAARLKAESERGAALSKKFDDLNARETARELTEVLDSAEARGVSKEDATDWHKTFGKTKALELVGKFPVKVQSFGRSGVGGQGERYPSHASPVVRDAGGNAHPTIGFGLAQQARKVAAEQKISLSAAYLIVAPRKANEQYS